jgi:LytS/YehU family sensor histidine kinase
MNIRKESIILQQQASLKQKIAETEMQALRAQMNPHFIFNSLNSIENFIMKNDKRMASDYFAKFASLIRMILDSSRNELVPFAKDLEALKLYVELEQLRFDHKFSYQTIVDPELLNEDYSVPPLLIQPYVENAIIHGLAQSDKEDLRLLVAAKLDKGYIIYTIQDNGIGRKQSAVYKQGNYLYKSMGMEITQQRINVHNKQQQAAGEVTITDLQDEFGEPKGTKVQVKLKAI